MRYWFDTEFIEDGKTIDLLSIGIVAEDGRELYLESTDADLSKANEWVRAHVFPGLGIANGDRSAASDRPGIAAEIMQFCDPERYGKPEFWAYYADYDWVVFCQLFGRMIDLPPGFPMYCRDIKQLADDLGNPKLPKTGSDEHNALIDARWNRTAWAILEGRRHAAQ